MPDFRKLVGLLAGSAIRGRVCQLPILSSQLPNCQQEPFFPDFRRFVVVQSQLQRAMERSTHTLMAAANMKQTEVAVRDLKTLIGLSSLVSKDDLSEGFEVFTRDARNTGRSLQKFGGRVGMAVDETIVTNNYAIKSLEAAGKGWNRRKDITATWFRMTGQTKSTIQKLISEASANLRALDILKNELDVIHTMLATEDHKAESDKEEMVSSPFYRCRC
ncbi:hypothetical protein FRC12_000682 [Ceratobasidium sp. 428]|nr:hypothetical protein FRC12_000682 [Ceratobasidium sp. 428]